MDLILRWRSKVDGGMFQTEPEGEWLKGGRKGNGLRPGSNSVPAGIPSGLTMIIQWRWEKEEAEEGFKWKFQCGSETSIAIQRIADGNEVPWRRKSTTTKKISEKKSSGQK